MEKISLRSSLLDQLKKLKRQVFPYDVPLGMTWSGFVKKQTQSISSKDGRTAKVPTQNEQLELPLDLNLSINDPKLEATSRKGHYTFLPHGIDVQLGSASTVQTSSGTTKPSNPKDSFGSSKAGISRVPASVLTEVGLAFDEGGAKYRGYNYRAAGVRASIYVDAVWRHLFQQFWDLGEDVDAESGLSHVTKAIASLVVLRDSMIRGNWTDDRPPKQPEALMKELNKKKEDLLKKYPNPKENYTEIEVAVS